MISFVAAVGENNVIGKNNRLPWRLPADARFFKETTLSGSKTMIMGRKTFESLPGVLPGRKHYILTANKAYRPPDHEDVLSFTVWKKFCKARSQAGIFRHRRS